ncbi:MAG: nucleotidyltransferase family protein [Coprococcus sp.]
MKIVGIIAEYNPFHNGHQYHIDQALQKRGQMRQLSL